MSYGWNKPCKAWLSRAPRGYRRAVKLALNRTRRIADKAEVAVQRREEFDIDFSSVFEWFPECGGGRRSRMKFSIMKSAMRQAGMEVRATRTS